MKARHLLLAVCVLAVLSPAARAGHPYDSGEHWQRTGQQRWIRVLDAVPGRDEVLDRVIADWSRRTPLVLRRVDAVGTGCEVPERGVKVCVSGRAWGTPFHNGTDHVVAGLAEVTQEALGTGARWILCHEIGHILGLDHRPWGAIETCMSYRMGSSRPDGHDRAVLRRLHGHVDA